MKKLFYVTLILLIESSSTSAQSGLLDLNFINAPGFNGSVGVVNTQTDGKIIVAGTFSSFSGNTRNFLARLNGDGSFDNSFNPGTCGPNSPCLPGFNDDVHSISIQADGKIIIGGEFTTYSGFLSNRIIRLNGNGRVDSTFNIGLGFNGSPATVETTKIQVDGKIIAGGSFSSFNGSSRNLVARINVDGSLDTSFNSGLLGINGRVRHVNIQPDGKIIISGNFIDLNGLTKYIARLNVDGSLDSTFNTGLGFNGEPLSTSIQQNGKILVCGAFTSFNGISLNRIARLNSDGSLDNTFNTGVGFNGWVRSLNIQTDGKIIVGGDFTSFNGFTKNYIARLNPNGSLDTGFITTVNLFVYFTHLQNDGKIILGGEFSSCNNTASNYIVRLIGDKGISGLVYSDVNANCLPETEIGLATRNLIINPGNKLVQTQNNGCWFVDSIPAGTYIATIDTSNLNWIPTCPITQTFSVVHPDSFVQGLNFGFVAAYPCPSPDISIVMPIMRRGFSNQLIYVQACNENTATGILDSAFTIVTLPAQITLQSASRTYTSLGNNRYRFYLGAINPGQCINFTLNTTVTTAAVANQTLCMSAELFPQAVCVFDSIPSPYILEPNTFISQCTTGWDNSSIQVEGYCIGDSVRFVIFNTGEPIQGDMSCFAPVRFYLNGQWVRFDSVQIAGNDSVIFVVPGTGGTWRLEVDQHPLHPGNSRPNTSVENCGNGTWTPGVINTMPQNDADPVIDIYCGQVTAPYDPNDKTGFPLGVGTNHNIRQNQQIEYLIRFQNVGTDTAVNVVIRDTLATDLNIFTVQSGVASHPYEFRMYGPRVLEWKFNNIMLPDSTTNEPASQGFVKFTVEQNPDLPFGTVIENSAAIYFDFEAPVITNTYFHTIHDFRISVVSSTKEEGFESVSVKVLPNPFSNQATLQLEGLENSDNLELEIFNLSGQRVQYLNNSQNRQFQLSKGEMGQGIYFFSIKQSGMIVARGKMVVE